MKESRGICNIELNYLDEYGMETNFHKEIDTEASVSLNEHLQAFKVFLQAVGYSYADELVLLDKDGRELASSAY